LTDHTVPVLRPAQEKASCFGTIARVDIHAATNWDAQNQQMQPVEMSGMMRKGGRGAAKPGGHRASIF
jgi:hypothetical protein